MAREVTNEDGQRENWFVRQVLHKIELLGGSIRKADEDRIRRGWNYRKTIEFCAQYEVDEQRKASREQVRANSGSVDQ